MSKTYRKNVRVGICGGKNTEYYRSRARRLRRVNNNYLRSMSKMADIEEMGEELMFETQPKRNQYMEPTDGTYTFHADDKNIDKKTPYSTRFINKVTRQFKKH